MPELPGRYVQGTGAMHPPLGTYVLLYKVPPSPAKMIYGVDICNKSGVDAHVRVAIMPGTWDGSDPLAYSFVVYNQRIEADSTDGNVWVMPVKHLESLDNVIVWTDTLGVTFYGHGFLYTP